jgi:hypothetical protein
MSNEELNDEIFALNSIYDVDCVVPLSPPSYTLTLPAPTPASITLIFPASYPLEPPSIAGCSGIPGGTRFVQDLLDLIWREGEVCLYDLVEGLQRVMHAPQPERAPKPELKSQGTKLEAQEEIPILVQPWTVSEPVVEKKSVFVARAIAVTSVADAKRFVADLVTGDKKVAKATHNISGFYFPFISSWGSMG